MSQAACVKSPEARILSDSEAGRGGLEGPLFL
jgi:hypothetical protein